MSLPNQLSLLRIILAPLFLYFFLSGDAFYVKLSLAIFLIATMTDWYDGWHARKYGLVSKVGIFLDPLADKVLTSAALIGFYVLGFMPLWMVLIIVVRDIVITLLRSYQEMKGVTLKTSFAAKTKTFIQMVYLFLIVILVSCLSFDITESNKIAVNEFLYSGANYFLMLIVTLLTLYTGITYFFESERVSVKTNENN